ncbi:nucleotidyltransferase/DNA polymerase involved in DNA repair [Terriglobus roseus DSM 18391]|uniref:DNA polymerase IV n=1 Tax=Terriglobus roseus (strain DSM 18391 / NRRL B-41598 / KBS 63) TaxID=926566 RepID=I3ZIQ6_TERRK|nr:DNA polymerase IV [Terriglobus roseus]AFL89124.1 nucleotidyltransferase/DNA polymerase involved in DNA repair [Terriglobus roseus DSM 18391]
MSLLGTRKIVHVDMDAFYASVEQRDDPALRGRPVVVAWKGPRSVVCAASYEARRFGIRSAMPAVRAERLCPEAVFVPPDFTRYKAVSHAVRAIFERHTDAIEPLSLDEAYLDVTTNKTSLPTATLIAKSIRQQIYDELNLTASAGIAPNKFLAKIASDWRKPNGQFVIQPHEAEEFLRTLPVGRIPGVGKVTEARMAEAGIKLVGDIYAMSLATLEQHFGSYSLRLHELARGIDHNPVVSNRVRKQVSAEDTFPEDLPLTELEAHVCRLAEKVWKASEGNARRAKTVVLKLKTKEFNSLTRSLTPRTPVSTCEDLISTALGLRDRVDLPAQQLYRLVGVGLTNFELRDDSVADSEPAEAVEPIEFLLRPV